MRSYIRHPSSIPIGFQLESGGGRAPTTETEQALNVSKGGLAFLSRHPIAPGKVIRVRIPLVDPPFEALGHVAWCHQRADHYEIGMAFLDDADIFPARMVEQLCHIEAYRRRVRHDEGRALSSEEAAREWIERFAPHFPGAGGGRGA